MQKVWNFMVCNAGCSALEELAADGEGVRSFQKQARATAM
jgi:hypothetical protein